MARAATAPELALFRTALQVSRMYLIVDSPAVVYQARVNQSFTSRDKISKVQYNNGVGTRANVLTNMTMLVGSTAGSDDYGQARIRKAPDGTYFYVGENSEIAWANGAYLTVLDDFGIWPRHINVLRDKTVKMDWDIAYSNQHTATAPVPVWGTDVVLKLVGATVSYTPDASGSWCLAAGTKTYAYTAPGASATSGMSTATPTITYNAVGRYRVTLVVTVGGVSTTAYRWVHVWSAASPAVTDFKVTQAPKGSWDAGGWEFEIEMWASASVRDRAKVILFAEDWYGSTKISVGPLPGSENIICIRWIDGETITTDPRTGKTTFSVKGPHYWFSRIGAYPIGQEIVSSTSAVKKWTQFAGLTVDKSLWHLLYWRTTAITCMDVTLTGDTRKATALEAPTGDLWAQMTTIASESIFAHPHCDRYGRLYVSVDPQLTPASGRAGYPTVMDVQTGDVVSSIGIARRQPDVSRVNLSGVAVSGTTGRPYFALSPGHVFKKYGSPLMIERVLLSSQAQANSLAGLMLGYRNLRYELDFKLAMNNRLIDICPPQYLGVSRTIAHRGVTVSGKFVPREVSYDLSSNIIRVSVLAEEESSEQQSCNGDIPVDPESTTQEPIEISIVVPPIVIPPPPLIVTGGTVNLVYVLVNSELGAGVYYTTNFQDAIPVWYPMHTGLDALHVPQQIWTASNGAIWAFDAINVYYGAYPGAIWQIVANYDTLQAQFGAETTNEWQGMGIDRASGNVLVISDGGFWHGNSSGLTMSLASYADILPSVASFGLGKWRARHYHWLFGNNVKLINAGVTAIEATSPELPAFGYYSIFETYDGYYYIVNGTSLGRVINNAISTPATVTLPATLDTYSSQAWQGIGIDLTGQYLAYPNGDTLHVSSDYGATWSTKTLPAWGFLDTRFQLQRIGASQIVFHQQHNAATGEAAILYSADGGTTWQDKTGNFSAITESARAIPVMLRAVTTESI